MTSTKPWYVSKGIVGGIVSVGSGVLGIYLGVVVPDAVQEQAVSIIVSLLAAVGGGVSAYGRAVAKDKIS